MTSFLSITKYVWFLLFLFHSPPILSQSNFNSESRVYINSSHDPSLNVDEANFESTILNFVYTSISGNQYDGNFDLHIDGTRNLSGKSPGAIYFYSLNLNLESGKVITNIDGDDDPLSFDPDHIRVDFRPNGVDNHLVEVNSGEIAITQFSEALFSFSFDLAYIIEDEEHTVSGEVVIVF